MILDNFPECVCVCVFFLRPFFCFFSFLLFFIFACLFAIFSFLFFLYSESFRNCYSCHLVFYAPRSHTVVTSTFANYNTENRKRHENAWQTPKNTIKKRERKKITDMKIANRDFFQLDWVWHFDFFFFPSLPLIDALIKISIRIFAFFILLFYTLVSGLSLFKMALWYIFSYLPILFLVIYFFKEFFFLLHFSVIFPPFSDFPASYA